jgi:hypothetical protein
MNASVSAPEQNPSHLAQVKPGPGNCTETVYSGGEKFPITGFAHPKFGAEPPKFDNSLPALKASHCGIKTSDATYLRYQGLSYETAYWHRIDFHRTNNRRWIKSDLTHCGQLPAHLKSAFC